MLKFELSGFRVTMSLKQSFQIYILGINFEA
jgi:hypothetical protein